MPKGVKALWNYSQTELDLESHNSIVSKQEYYFSSALGFIDAMQRTSCILLTTIFQMQFCSAISHAFRSDHNFRPCHFNLKLMQRTFCILQTTIFQMQFCLTISHAFRSGHNFRPCHFNPKRSLTPVHILGFAEQMRVLFLKAQRTT